MNLLLLVKVEIFYFVQLINESVIYGAPTKNRT